MPRKVNAVNSASEPPKAPKRSKVTSSLKQLSTSSMECDNTNTLSRENPEHANEARCISIDENAISLNQESLMHIEPEEMHSKIGSDCTSCNENQMSQKEKISVAIDNAIDDNETEYDASLRLHQDSNDETENTSELRSSSIDPTRVHSKEARLKLKDKSLDENEFNQEKIMPDIVSDVENQRWLNLSQHSNDELHFELEVSKKSQLSEHEDKKEERETDSPKQDHETRSKIIDESLDESEDQLRDTSCTSLSDDRSSNEATTNSDCVTESRNEQLKQPHRFACQRPPKRTIPSSFETKENVEKEAMKCAQDVTHDAVAKNNFERDRETCTVISTIPKCEYLDRAVKEDSISSSATKCDVASMDGHEFEKHLQNSRTAENVDKSQEKREDQTEETSSNVKSTKRTKVRTKVRSQSKSDDFKMDSLKRQRRYLTSPSENIAHALNLNLSARNSISFNVAGKQWEQSAAGHCANGDTRDANVDKRESWNGGLVTGACCCITNILL